MESAEEDFSGGFPSEYVAPREKEKPEYGLKYAKAMYGASNRLGPNIFFDDSEYNALIEVAQGRQSVDGIKRLYGYFERPFEQDDSDELAYIDVQVLNLAPKYINRAVAKMQRYSYDISADAVDPVSVNEKEAYGAAIQAFYRLNNWLKDININVKEMFPELDVDMLPQFMDELAYDAITNPKIKTEIWAEIALQLLHFINEYQQKMREVDWDIAVLGKGHMHFYYDEKGYPRCERINPKYAVGSYVDNENFTDQEYAGFFDWLTENQVRKEMLADGYTDSEIKELVSKWTMGAPPSTDLTGNFNRFDGLTYIPVLRFYFRSEDNRRYVVKKGKYEEVLKEKSFDYEPDEETYEKHFATNERRLVKNDYTSIYGGTWIIDTDVVFDYGRKKYPRMELVNATLPIKTFAPNMKNGRVVSLMAQMIEPLFMINVAHNKIKEYLAKGWMGLREIDFGMLEDVKLGKGGQVWTPRQVYEFIVKTNIVPTRTKVNQWEQVIKKQTVSDYQTGVTLADYFTTISTYINLLEQMTSAPLADQLNPPDRMSATAAKQSALTSDVDMEWLFNAHENMYLQGSHQLLLMLQETLSDGNKVEGWVPALGSSATSFFQVPEQLAYCELGIRLTRKPTEEMWAQFYTDVQIALQNQEISLADSVFLREIDNLKKARQIMVVRANQYKREKRQEAEFNNNLAIQSNQAAAEAKLRGEIEKERAKAQTQQEVELLKGRIAAVLADAQNHWDANMLSIENMSKERMVREQNMGTIIKESMRSRAERYKSNAKIQETVISAAQKAQTEHKKLQQPKSKPKSKK